MNPTVMIRDLPKGKEISCIIMNGKLQSLTHRWPLRSYFFTMQTSLHVCADSHPDSAQLVQELHTYARSNDCTFSYVGLT